eukprot:m.107928 g.107928  ORF g.107928 m.107928 type:complete len:868 (+) comp15874_c0_seq1:325-2928(+)
MDGYDFDGELNELASFGPIQSQLQTPGIASVPHAPLPGQQPHHPTGRLDDVGDMATSERLADMTRQQLQRDQLTSTSTTDDAPSSPAPEYTATAPPAAAAPTLAPPTQPAPPPPAIFPTTAKLDPAAHQPAHAPPPPTRTPMSLMWDAVPVGQQADRTSPFWQAVLFLYARLRLAMRTMPEFSAAADKLRIPVFGRGLYPLVILDALGRGISQCVFINNPLSGVILFLAMFQNDPWVATVAAIGLATSTAFAHFLGLDKRFIRHGLYGFSGFLVAGTVAYFSAAEKGAAVVPAMLMSVLSVFFFSGFVTLITVPYGVPPLGAPFSVVGLCWILSVYNSAYLPTITVPQAQGGVADIKLTEAVDWKHFEWDDVLYAVFRGYAIIVFGSEVHTGLIVFVAIFLGSPILAVYSWVAGLFGMFWAIGTATPAPGIAAPGPIQVLPNSFIDPAGVPYAPPQWRPPPPGRLPFPDPTQQPNPGPGPGPGPAPGPRPGPGPYPRTTLPPYTTTAHTTTAAFTPAESSPELWTVLYSGAMCMDAIYAGIVAGMFWLPSVRTMLLALFLGCMAAMLKNTFATVFYVWGAPTFAFPFCFLVFPLLINHKYFPAFVPIDLSAMTVPEDHIRRYRVIRKLFHRLREELKQNTHAATRAAIVQSLGSRMTRAQERVSATQTNGLIDRNLLVLLMRDLHILPSSSGRTWDSLLPSQQNELQAWFRAVDTDRSGRIPFSQFQIMIADAVHCHRIQALVHSFFDVMGAANKGYLTRFEVRTAFAGAKEVMTRAEELRLFARADRQAINGPNILLDTLTPDDAVIALLPPALTGQQPTVPPPVVSADPVAPVAPKVVFRHGGRKFRSRTINDGDSDDDTMLLLP